MRAGIGKNRRPFWLPASNYYVLAVAVSAAVFFLIWGILRDEGDDTPWITAGVSASMLLCVAVIVREVILRRARSRIFNQTKIDNLARGVQVRIGDSRHQNKLTLEKNAAILSEIRKKSSAANVLSKLSAGHREVFELCGEYLARNEAELGTISAGSPRLVALLKGRSAAAEMHKHHLLKWAEIEARSLTGEVKSGTTITKKVEAAQNALRVVESALESYPAEASLLESQEVLQEMVVSVKVSDLVEKAERAAFKGDNAKAKSLYQDALFYLGRDKKLSDDRLQAERQIKAEMDRILALESGK